MTRRSGRGKTAPTAPRKDTPCWKRPTPKPHSFNAYDRPHDDLREFIARAESADEIVRIKGADWKLEMGTLAEIVNHARPEPPAILFEDVPGYPKGMRLPVRRDQLIEAPCDHARLAGAQGPARRGARLSRPHEDPSADRAEDRGEGPGVREHRPRRQGRRAEIPGAVPARARRRPLHRHRRSRDHARPRGQLGQLRHLSRHGAGQEPRLGVDLAGQARAARSARNISAPASPARC